MSNIVNLPPNEESGLYKAPSHEKGGVQVIVDGVSKVEVEGGEIQICRTAMMSDDIHEFKDLTNKEILDEIFKHNSCVFKQGKADSGDFIICKLVVNDGKKRNLTGTTKEIINKLQEEKACNVTEDVKERVNRQGGGLTSDEKELTAEEEAKVRLDILKRMQRRKPTKVTADKIRALSKEIRKGFYKNGGSVKKVKLPEDYRPELVAIHSLSCSNLMFADKLGGISMPSIAVVRITNPITQFGDVVLVAPKDFIDPEKNSSARIFNRDIYSPTYPKLFSYVDKLALNKLQNDLYKKKRDWNIVVSSYLSSDLAQLEEKISKGTHLPEVLESAEKNDFVIYLWAKENNVEIDVPLKRESFQYWIYNPDTDVDFISNIQIKYPALWEVAMKGSYDYSNEEFHKQLADAFRENWMKNKVDNETDEEAKKDYTDLLEGHYEDGLLNYNLDYNIFKSLVIALKDYKVIDSGIWRETINRVREENTDAIHEFTKNMIDKVMSGSYFFRTKSSKTETSLSNIYDYMSGRSIKSSEKTLVHGLGKSASMSAKEYDSLTAVARDKNHYTVSKHEFEAYEKKQDELWNKVTNKVRQYHSSVSDFSFDALDDLSKAMGILSRYKSPSDEKINEVLSRNSYGKTPSYVYDVVRDFSECLRNAPAEYFEVKMDDIVKIKSFIGACVPNSISECTIELLHKNGISNVVKYDSSDYENKQHNLADALVEVVSKSKDVVLFEKGGDVFNTVD